MTEIRVPGANPTLDDLGFHKKDSKGRHMWDMPDPTGYAEHTKHRRHKHTGEAIQAPEFVPVYKGISAEDLRYYRSQYRRMIRKEEERKSKANATADEALDSIKEITHAIQDA
jgi:hypothetical protein